MRKYFNVIANIFCFLFVVNVVFAQDLPKLKSGQNLREILNENGGYRWLSGYSITEFRINPKGLVDSVAIVSNYYAKGEDDLIKSKELRFVQLIKSLEFEAFDRSRWVQCKIYVKFHSERTPDPENPSKPDRMRLFNYGFEELWRTETQTYFTDPITGFKEYILLNDKIIIAPIFLDIIT